MPRIKTIEKKDAILDAAARVFATKDFHDVLIDEVAEAGGLGKGTVYRYFRTKEDLYFATILRGLDRLHAALESASRARATPAERLERIAREVLTFFWNQKSLRMLFYRDERNFPARRADLRQRHERLIHIVQQAILEGIERREFRGVDAFVAAELFWGMLRWIDLYRRETDTIEDLVNEIVRVLLRGISLPAV